MAKKKEVNYFDLFVDAIDCSQRAAVMLREMLRENNIKIDDIMKLHGIEHEGDLIRHQIVSELSRAFITPIEREDILELSRCIDDLTDSIEDIATRIDMFNITSIRPEAIEFINLIVDAADATKEALVEFKNFKKSKTINSMIININKLEEDGDKLYHDSVRRLFVEEEGNILEIIRWREAFEIMEHCCDAFEDVADIIESIIMKNS